MGSKEESTPTKSAKPAAATQELPTTPSYPDWPTPLPAYYGAGAAGSPVFYPPTVSSPAPHPYLWGSQHLMPPYGTPLPYPPIYPHGGLYTHPSMAVAQGTIMTPTEPEVKPSEGKARGSSKKSKGGSGIGSGKAVSSSANDSASQSGESGSEGSSDASDENTNESSENRKRSFDQMLADGANAQNNNATQYSGAALNPSFAARGPTNLPVSVPGNPAATMPPTHLNIGMDLWNTSSGAPTKGRPNAVTASPAVVPPVAGREGMPTEHMWINDERELKRQKRKQSNRESARRSRLRKQAEYEELAAKVETLKNEKQTLRNELQRLAEECEKLTSENASITEQLARLCGQDETANAEINDTNTSVFQPVGREGNGHTDEAQKANPVATNKSRNFFSSNGNPEAGSN